MDTFSADKMCPSDFKLICILLFLLVLCCYLYYSSFITFCHLAWHDDSIWYRKIPTTENPYSCMFYAVCSDGNMNHCTKTMIILAVTGLNPGNILIWFRDNIFKFLKFSLIGDIYFIWTFIPCFTDVSWTRKHLLSM